MLTKESFKKLKEEQGFKVKEVGNSLVIHKNANTKVTYFFSKEGLYYGCAIKKF